MIIRIAECAGSFAEDKDTAKEIRQRLLQALRQGEPSIVLDFAEVESSSQSFIHAMLSKALMDYGEEVLERLQFHNCSERVKRLVAMVTNYSLE